MKNPTIESLATLEFINRLIWQYINSLNIKISPNDTNYFVFTAIKSQIILLTCAYLDEWDIFLGTEKDGKKNTEIRDLKRKLSPAINRLRKWDLKNCRNRLIAHNFRDNNFKSVFLSSETEKIKCPEHISELFLITELIDFATKKMIENYKSDVDEMLEIMFPKIELKAPKSIDFKKEFEDIKKIIMNNCA